MKKIDPRPGQRLRQVREHRGMSQGRLARTIGVSIGTIQSYEHARVRIPVDRLEQLAQVLQCEPADLLKPPGSRLPLYRHWRVGNPWRRHRVRDETQSQFAWTFEAMAED